MAKTIDDVVGALQVKEGQREAVNPSYDPKTLAESYKGLEQLEKINLETGAGLREYQQLTGQDLKGRTLEELEGQRQQTLARGRRNLDHYIIEHEDAMIKGLNKQTAAAIAWEHLPSKPHEHDEDFEEARSFAYQSKEAIALIEHDPETFFAQRLEAQTNSAMRSVMIRYKDDFIRIKEEQILAGARAAIEAYGPVRFLEQTRAHIDRQARDAVEETQRVNNELRQAIQEFEEDEEEISAQKRAQLHDEAQAKLTQAIADYPDARLSQSLTGSVFRSTLSLYDRRRRQEAREAEQEQGGLAA